MTNKTIQILQYLFLIPVFVAACGPGIEHPVSRADTTSTGSSTSGSSSGGADDSTSLSGTGQVFPDVPGLDGTGTYGSSTTGDDGDDLPPGCDPDPAEPMDTDASSESSTGVGLDGGTTDATTGSGGDTADTWAPGCTVHWPTTTEAWCLCDGVKSGHAMCGPCEWDVMWGCICTSDGTQANRVPASWCPDSPCP